MSITLHTLLGIGLIAASASAFAADVSVVFAHPETYTDAAEASPFPSDKDRAAVQRGLEQHLQQLAQRRLAPGDVLKIEVLDIDLAGQFEPFRSRDGSDLRIVRETTWPRISLRYTLSQGGQVVASAEDRVADMNFRMAGNRYSSSDPLRDEKAMLDRWFEDRIGRRDRPNYE